jgi:hypothetical protein
MKRLRRITALSAVTATTTSKKFWVGGASRIGIQLRRADHSSGSSAFAVKGSLEPLESAQVKTKDEFNNPHGGTGVTVTALNMLIDNVTNTNAQTLTRVNGKTLSSNGDAFLWIPPECLVNWLEITVTETTDGTHSAWIVVEEEMPSVGAF